MGAKMKRNFCEKNSIDKSILSFFVAIFHFKIEDQAQIKAYQIHFK
jgi:hypothetical protein